MPRKSNMQEVVDYLRRVDHKLCAVIDVIGPLTITDHLDPFEFLVREVVGQMFSAQAKKAVYAKLVALCDNHITPQTLTKFDISDLRGIGLSRSKSATLISLSKMVLSHEITLENYDCMTNEEVEKDLTRIKGIGSWTAKMYLLFYLQREDVLPYEDGAFMQAFRWLFNYKNVSSKTVISRCKKWSPFSSYASRYLYIALDSGLTRIPIEEFLGTGVI